MYYHTTWAVVVREVVKVAEARAVGAKAGAGREGVAKVEVLGVAREVVVKEVVTVAAMAAGLVVGLVVARAGETAVAARAEATAEGAKAAVKVVGGTAGE